MTVESAQNNPQKRGVEVCSCHCGQVGSGGGVGTKILACGAPRAFPGCHFLGQNYTPGQTGNQAGAVPQTSVVCSHNCLHVPPVCLSSSNSPVYLVLLLAFYFVRYSLPQTSRRSNPVNPIPLIASQCNNIATSIRRWFIEQARVASFDLVGNGTISR